MNSQKFWPLPFETLFKKENQKFNFLIDMISLAKKNLRLDSPQFLCENTREQLKCLLWEQNQNRSPDPLFTFCSKMKSKFNDQNCRIKLQCNRNLKGIPFSFSLNSYSSEKLIGKLEQAIVAAASSHSFSVQKYEKEQICDLDVSLTPINHKQSANYINQQAFFRLVNSKEKTKIDLGIWCGAIDHLTIVGNSDIRDFADLLEEVKLLMSDITIQLNEDFLYDEDFGFLSSELENWQKGFSYQIILKMPLFEVSNFSAACHRNAIQVSVLDQFGKGGMTKLSIKPRYAFKIEEERRIIEGVGGLYSQRNN